MKNSKIGSSLFIILVYSLLIMISCQSESAKLKLRGNNPITTIDSIQNAPQPQSKFIKGTVVGIVDGDTYDLKVTGAQLEIRVRMEGINAPERGEPYYKKAKEYLSSLCFGKEVSFEQTGRGSYNRPLGYTYLTDGRELSQEMIKAGLARHFKKYNSDEILANLEIQAQRMKLGIWSQ